MAELGLCRMLWLLRQCTVLDQSKKGTLVGLGGNSWSRERLYGGLEGVAVAKWRGGDSREGLQASHLPQLLTMCWGRVKIQVKAQSTQRWLC